MYMMDTINLGVNVVIYVLVKKQLMDKTLVRKNQNQDETINILGIK